MIKCDVTPTGTLKIELITNRCAPNSCITVDSTENTAALIDLADVLGGVDNMTILLPSSSDGAHLETHWNVLRDDKGVVWVTTFVPEGDKLTAFDCAEVSLHDQMQLLACLQDSFEIGLGYTVPVHDDYLLDDYGIEILGDAGC